MSAAPAKILVSACLLGQRVRYDGRAATASHPCVERWRREGRIVPFCPEVAGGLPVPRPAAEIVGGDGSGVLRGEAEVRSRGGDDVSAAFLRGAEEALAQAEEQGIRVALLKERSPSCGSRAIYDGSFSGRVVVGMGVTAALLREHGVAIFSEAQIEEADAWLRELDVDGTMAPE